MAKFKNIKTIVTTEDVVTTEIFGDDIRTEISRAKKVLKDFADFNNKIRKDYKILVEQINSCTRKGEVSKVMWDIRHNYM